MHVKKPVIEGCFPCLAEGLAPVDLLLLMASKENDAPKVAELIRAGADLNTKVRPSDLVIALMR